MYIYISYGFTLDNCLVIAFDADFTPALAARMR